MQRARRDDKSGALRLPSAASVKHAALESSEAASVSAAERRRPRWTHRQLLSSNFLQTRTEKWTRPVTSGVIQKPNLGKADLFGEYFGVWTSSAAAPETVRWFFGAGRSREERKKEAKLGADRRQLRPVEDPLGAGQLIV